MTAEEREKQRVVLKGLRRDGRILAGRFKLGLVMVDAERAQVRRRYGVCYSDGTIRIRLRHARTGRLLKYSALVDTLCHELAHLRHFDHGSRFQAFYRRILGDARRIGIYRPSPPQLRRTVARASEQLVPLATSGPRQLELF